MAKGAETPEPAGLIPQTRPDTVDRAPVRSQICSRGEMAFVLDSLGKDSMDPVTTAIVTALTKLGESVINDAYTALKTALAKKYGSGSDVVEAVDKLEQKPDSTGRRETLREEVVAAGADQDGEILSVAQALLDRVRTQPDGQQVVQQTVTGHGNIFSGTGSVTVNRP